MGKVMLTIHGHVSEEPPPLAEVMQALKLSWDEVDPEFGVQMIDPVAGDWVILVEDTAAERVIGTKPVVSGPYADVEIQPMGPPKS